MENSCVRRNVRTLQPKMRAGACVLACALGAMASSGVASASTAKTQHSSVSRGGAKTIEFIPTSNATPYFLDEYAGVKKQAALYGYKTVFQAPSVSMDISTEIGMVKTATSDRVSGIVLVPYSPTALLAPVRAAEKAGIPVVVTDSTLTPMIAKTFTAVNDVKGAEAIAAYAAGLVHGKGQYGIIDYNLSTTSGLERRQGFKAEMAKFPGMKFAGLEISNSVVQTALQETTTMLEKNPHINVMFGANDRSALGVAEAVQRLHLQNKVVVVGFDADLGEINYIKSGVIKGSTLQSPVLMGETAVKALHEVFAGKKLPAYIPLPYHIVTYKNYSSPTSVAAIRQYILNYKG